MTNTGEPWQKNDHMVVFMAQLDHLARRVRNQLPPDGEKTLTGVNEQDERLIRTAMSVIQYMKGN